MLVSLDNKGQAKSKIGLKVTIVVERSQNWSKGHKERGTRVSLARPIPKSQKAHIHPKGDLPSSGTTGRGPGQ